MKMHPLIRLSGLTILLCAMAVPRSGHAQDTHRKPDASWARLSLTTEPLSGLGFGFGGAIRVGPWIAGGHGRMYRHDRRSGGSDGGGAGMVQVGRRVLGTGRMLVWPSLGAGIMGNRSEAWFTTEGMLNMDVFLRPRSRRGGPVVGWAAGVRNQQPVLEFHLGWGQ